MTELNFYTLKIVDLRAKKGFKTSWKNVAEKTMLIVTELGRVVDADREHNKELVGHELIDALVRLLDLIGSLGFDGEELLQKNLQNWEKRIYKHGKAY